MERVTVAVAAKRLGISKGAVRARIRRGTIGHERDEDGRVYVYVARDADQGEPGEPTLAQSVETIEAELRAQVEHLRYQLQQEHEANRENRRLLALQLEHLRALEPRKAPQTGGEEQGGIPAQEESFTAEEPPQREVKRRS
jgi:hypothetical protein